jgi:hypothetical protein
VLYRFEILVPSCCLPGDRLEIYFLFVLLCVTDPHLVWIYLPEFELYHEGSVSDQRTEIFGR